MSRRRSPMPEVSTHSEHDGQVATLAQDRGHQESKLLSALGTIESLWEEMLTPPARGRTAATSGDGVLLADDSESTADMPRTVVVINARMEVCRSLVRWVSEIVDQHDVQYGQPDVHDAIEMARFLRRWRAQAVELDDGEELVDEVESCASVVTRCARPQRRQWLSLGPCPLEYEHPEEEEKQRCPGEVRSYGSVEGDEGQSWATCSACSTKAVASWWEEMMFGTANSEPLTTDQVITFVHRAYGRLVKRTTIQMWVTRGDLASCGKDDQGRRLYDRTAVAWAMERQEQRRGASVR